MQFLYSPKNQINNRNFLILLTKKFSRETSDGSSRGCIGAHRDEFTKKKAIRNDSMTDSVFYCQWMLLTGDPRWEKETEKGRKRLVHQPMNDMAHNDKMTGYQSAITSTKKKKRKNLPGPSCLSLHRKLEKGRKKKGILKEKDIVCLLYLQEARLEEE